MRAQTLSLPGRLRFLPFRAQLFVAAHQEHGLGHAAERTRGVLELASGIVCEAYVRISRTRGLTCHYHVKILEELNANVRVLMQILDNFVFVELDSETWYAIFIFRQLFSGTPTSILAFVRAPGRRTWLSPPVGKTCHTCITLGD